MELDPYEFCLSKANILSTNMVGKISVFLNVSWLWITL